MPIDLEFLKTALKDNQIWMSYAKVLNVSIDDDRAAMRALVRLLPTEYEASVLVPTNYVGPGFGIYLPLRANDLVLVGFPSGDPDAGAVLQRLSSKEDTIPTEFNNDKIVIKAKSDEEIVIVTGSKTKVGTKDSAENLVKGQVFKTMMSTLLEALSIHQHISSPPGFLSFAPNNATTYLDLKDSPVDDEEVLSNKNFTE